MSMECKIGHQKIFCSGALKFFLLPLGYQRVNKNSMWESILESRCRIFSNGQFYAPWTQQKKILKMHYFLFTSSSSLCVGQKSLSCFFGKFEDTKCPFKTITDTYHVIDYNDISDSTISCLTIYNIHKYFETGFL